MLVPISKVLITNSRIESYNLYDVNTHKVINWTIADIKRGLRAGYDIRGFIGQKVRLIHYFSNIGVAGEKQDERQHYTVVKRKVYSKKMRFSLVDIVGKEFEFEKGELINLIKNGAIVSGVRLEKKDILRVSRAISTEVM